MVDPTDTSHEDWIETYPKQRKWACDESEEAHRTLEVRSWSTELFAASLNVQFLPILEDRAPDTRAMKATFVRNMIIESQEEIEALKQALQQTELFRKWTRDNAQPGSQRLIDRGVPFLGGLPDGYDDIMNFLVDGGLRAHEAAVSPRSCLSEHKNQRYQDEGGTEDQNLQINVCVHVGRLLGCS